MLLYTWTGDGSSAPGVIAACLLPATDEVDQQDDGAGKELWTSHHRAAAVDEVTSLSAVWTVWSSGGHTVQTMVP